MARPEVPGSGPRCRRTVSLTSHCRPSAIGSYGGAGLELPASLTTGPRVAGVVERREVGADGVDLLVAEHLARERRHHG